MPTEILREDTTLRNILAKFREREKVRIAYLDLF